MTFAGGLGEALGAVGLWSTNALAARNALGDLSVAQTLLCQFAGALASLAVCSRFGGGGAMGWRELPQPRWLAVGIVGVVGTVWLQYLAFTAVPIVEANILSYGWPVLVAAWGALVLRGRGLALAAGLTVLAFAGTVVLLGGGALASATPRSGHLLALGSALCMAVFSIAARRCERPLAMLLGATAAGLAASLVAVLAEARPFPGAAGALTALYIGAGPMGLGYLLWTRAMRLGDPARLAVVGYVTPLVSTALLLAAGERVSGQALVGALMILGGQFRGGGVAGSTAAGASAFRRRLLFQGRGASEGAAMTKMMQTTQTAAEAAQSIQRSLQSLSEEAENAELDFVAYLIGMAIMELDDVIAAKSSRH